MGIGVRVASSTPNLDTCWIVTMDTANTSESHHGFHDAIFQSNREDKRGTIQSITRIEHTTECLQQILLPFSVIAVLGSASSPKDFYQWRQHPSVGGSWHLDS